MIRSPRRTRDQVGIHLDSAAVHLALAQQGQASTIKHAVSLARPDPAAEFGTDDVARITSVFGRRNFPMERCVMAVPAPMLRSTTVSVPPQRSKNLQADTVRTLVAGRLNAQDSELAWWPTPRREGDDQRLFVTAVEHDTAELLLKLIEMEGIELSAMESESMALVRFLGACECRSSGISLVVLVQRDYLLIVAIQDESIIFERVQEELGLDHLCAELTDSHEIDARTIGCVLSNSGGVLAHDSATAGAVRELLNAYNDKVADAANASALYVGRQFSQSDIENVFVLGAGTWVQGLKEMISARVGIDAVVPDTMHFMGIADHETVIKSCVAIGLALRP